MSRKTNTPKWLSIVRKIYLYVGATAIYSIVDVLSIKDTKLIVEIYGVIGFGIQVFCDTYYKKETNNFPIEAKNIRE